jgi:GNAT superfamily N-acetyltransferase
MSVFTVQSDADILSCLRVMQFLRPHVEETTFVAQIREQEAQGYRLIAIRDSGRVCAAAGYRMGTFLAWGRILYVDDLITDPEKRKRGLGSTLLQWLISKARSENCAQLHLDSGYHRFAAHRFYLDNGLQLYCHHFAIKLHATAE